MKTIKNALVVVAVLFAWNGVAQAEVDGKLEATTTKKYSIEKDGKKIPYLVKVIERRQYEMKLADEDKGKLNQARVKLPAYVTKLIMVNKGADEVYDQFIVLRYEKSPNDSFTLEPTLHGFAVKVDEKELTYIFGEGFYFVNNEDNDFFVVDEFFPMS